GLDTEFQRGHTAVSAFWGALGLALLYVGLKRDSRSIRVAGLAFFAVSLAKIFLYDLPALSAVTRALSFLAVGAVLLLGGFFYQRLTTSEDEPRRPLEAPPTYAHPPSDVGGRPMPRTALGGRFAAWVLNPPPTVQRRSPCTDDSSHFSE